MHMKSFRVTCSSSRCLARLRVAALPDSPATSLSDLITFESELAPSTSMQSTEDPTLKAQAILSRATKALAMARELVAEGQPVSSSPSFLTFSSPPPSEGLESTRSVLTKSLSTSPTTRPTSLVQNEVSPASPPTWVTSLFNSDSHESSAEGGGKDENAKPPTTPTISLPTTVLKKTATPALREIEFAEPTLRASSFLNLISQEAQDVARARQSELPILQSVLDLTTASKPPLRQGEEAQDETLAMPKVSGKMLKDGTGVLADGTVWEKRSGEELGPDGYCKKWTMLKGASADGSVTWEECWWEASDWKGLRELGAAKKGTAEGGAAWNEQWSEKMYNDPSLGGDRVVERSAHKWARDEMADEWEEQWGEKYSEKGPANKWADKWAKSSENVWHERWGEDYDGSGGCVKYTDKWAERTVEGGAYEQWGDKWKESFKDGRGSKHGEVWSVGRDGERYNRYWNEEHAGEGNVRKYGHSTHGENWDSWERMDTYYNPIPHFGYNLAVAHSPDLARITLMRPGHVKKAQEVNEEEEEEGLSGGIGDL